MKSSPDDRAAGVRVLEGWLSFCCCSLLLILWTHAHATPAARISLAQMLETRPFLRQERPVYRNFVFDPFSHYPDHTWGRREPGIATRLDMREIERPQALWSPTGDYLATGYRLFSWVERRQQEQRRGSELFKDWASWSQEFDHMVVARDGYGGWGYSAIVGDGLIARFTPLTLSKTDFNGTRLDVSLPWFEFTALGSRIARPNRESYLSSENAAEVEVDHSTLLLGSRAQAGLGALRLGLNWVNLHAYNSIQTDNSIKGNLRLDQPLYEWLVVRVADDAPADGSAGAVVQSVQLAVNGRPRPDLRPRVVRHRAGVPSQVGRTLTSGEFLTFGAYRGLGYNRFYRGWGVPYYADYLYLLAHNAGEDVSGNTHLEGLLATFSPEDPEGILLADGDEQLIYLFDLRGETRIEEVEVEALVGNDYRVEWAGLYRSPDDPNASRFEARYESTFLRPALRARGRVEDGSNLDRVRFQVGENTGIFTYGADARLVLPWLEVNGEYARSAVYGRYPAQVAGILVGGAGPRHARRGSACFVNALYRFGRGRVGMEGFSMGPGFSTEMEAYLPRDFGYSSGRGYDPLSGLENDTMIWRLVQDNEDGDRWPDFSVGNILGTGRWGDGDGVLLGRDEDRDGFRDTDRNRNRVADFNEPFLMYWVEPDEYVYGLDRNHNDVPDFREDDLDPDYPYDADQRGYHLFGQADLSRHGSLEVGRYAIEGIEGGGHNRAFYALLGYRREGVGQLRRLFFENHVRRVQDEIEDGRRRGYWRDRLLYQDSYVNDTYMEAELRPWSTLNLVHKLRLRLNWQQGGKLANGLFQRHRRLDFWALVSRADYTWRWGGLALTPQFKLLFLHHADREANRPLLSEHRVIPILKLKYPLMSRTVMRAGVQGWGSFPYRVVNRTLRRESFEQRITFVTLTNHSRYFGYDLHTIVGVSWNRMRYENPLQRFRNFALRSFFVRGLVGFTEYGRPF